MNRIESSSKNSGKMMIGAMIHSNNSPTIAYMGRYWTAYYI